MAYLAHVSISNGPPRSPDEQVQRPSPLPVHLDGMVLGTTLNGMAQSNIQNFLMGALSDVATVRRDRRLATHRTFPDLVWIVLQSGGALMVRFSFMLGALAPKLYLLMTAALVASGLLVLL